MSELSVDKLERSGKVMDDDSRAHVRCGGLGPWKKVSGTCKIGTKGAMEVSVHFGWGNKSLELLESETSRDWRTNLKE